MSPSALTGKVQTVLGPIEPESLGITQTHEHLLIDLGCYFAAPEEASERAWIHKPLTMDGLGRAWRRFAYQLDFQQLLDVQVAIEEISRYKYAGGNSLVDATSVGIARDPLALTRISRATGLNVIMGSSYYVPVSYPPDLDQRSEQAIADEIIRDITVGVGDTGVRSGIIGEIGNFWPMTDTQRKVLTASANAQLETGAPILIHPAFDVESPPAIIGVLTEAGVDPRRIIMGHLDFFSGLGSAGQDVFRYLAETGCFMEWDVFGLEDTSFGEEYENPLIVPSDVQRIQAIEFAIEQGAGDRVLIAHDVCTKHQYARYGGKSYDHILTNIVPRMRRRGLGQDQIDAFLVHNPARILPFN